MAEWYVRTYVCGTTGIEDKTKFPMPDKDCGGKEKKRSKERALRKAEKNATEARHELSRTLNTNFRAGRDYHMTLEYKGEGYRRLTEKAGCSARDSLYIAADHEAELFIRRVQRECRKQGIKLKYVFVTSDMDGKTGKKCRVHHHLVVCREAIEICRKKWTAGATYDRTLYGGIGGDLGDLANYLIKQVRKVPGMHRYSPSRNLKKADPKTPVRSRNSEAEITAPKGCVLIWRAESKPGRPQHIRYWRPPGAGTD